MPTRRPSRTTTKPDKTLPPAPTKTRPGLAVDTSFSRHRGNVPEQVFPNGSNAQESRTAKPDHTIAPRKILTQPKKTVTAHQDLQPSRDAVPVTQTSRPLREAQKTSTAEPVIHKRIKGLRPSPLDLNNEVSPSDCAITIGLSIPSAALSNHEQSPQAVAAHRQSPPQTEQSQRYGYDVATPTIIITPAKEDFDVESLVFSEGLGRRPTSSVYSRYTNGGSQVLPPNQRTPPVPPLPKFAAKSNASLRAAARASSATKFEEDDSPPLVFQSRSALSVRTTFEEQTDEGSRSPPLTVQVTRENSQHVPTPRRSKGWWNVITSPFSAKSGAFSFRSAPNDDIGGDYEPMLKDASNMGYADRSVAFADQQGDDDDTRSAPATSSVRNFSLRTTSKTPKRSDTAPGAIDSGSSADVNIYRIPNEGEASSFYDSKRNFPSMVGPIVGGRPRALEDVGDFDPRKSCYQATRSVRVEDGDDTAPAEIRKMRESEFYRIPQDGEAAEYYDSNRTFPSLVPYGWEYGNKDMEDWTPRGSVMPKDAILGSGSLAESPSDIESADADKAVPSGQGKVVEKSPFQSGHAAEFEGFSGTYGPSERKFFSSPSENEMNGRTPPVPPVPKSAPYPLSPTPEATPVLEDAHVATFTGSTLSNDQPKEVDVASNTGAAPAPAPLGPSAPANGLGDATTATREAAPAATYPPPAAISETPPYPVAPQHSRNESRGLGIADDETERGLFPPPAALNEKSADTTDYPKELPPRKQKSSRRWICCLLPLIFGILVAVIAFTCAFFIPFPHSDRPVQAQWVNLSGFPPLPTGISTVIGPKPVKEISGCVAQEQLWTCAVPAREVYMATPGQTDQPNFRFEIRFRDNIVPSNETVPVISNSSLSKRSTGQAAQAGAVVKRSTAWTNLLFSSSPAPPSTDDQKFIGRTTDNSSVPFDGAETPFYISLLDAGELTSNYIPGLQKRDPDFHYPYPTTSNVAPSGTPSTNTSSETMASTTVVPGPTNVPSQAIRGDGRPAPAVLYPFAYAQPLRLHNRGQSTEHYSFYTYFDRSMYLSVSSLANSYTFGGDITPNVQLANANAVCTWSQTRLHFQIWTQKADVTSLFVSDPSKVPLLNSSATDMDAPGSFPYSVTVTLDRHGGDAAAKGVYCNSLNGDQQVTDTVRTWISENRGFDGELVNPAVIPMNNGTTLTKRSDSNGIDGGSGGCACQWQNWE